MAFCGELQTPAYASAAAGIMAIEAGHAAVIREQLFVVSFSPESSIHVILVSQAFMSPKPIQDVCEQC